MDCPNPKKPAVAEAGFPDDALVEILSRLPVKPLHRSKCVAKAWRDLIADPLHRKKLPQTLQGFFVIDGGIYSRRGGHKRGRFGFVNLLPRSTPLDIDPSFSFLKKLAEVKILTLSDCCNGLLFEHGRRKSGPSDELGYIVCNPTTKQWEAVPRYGSWPSVYPRREKRHTYLVFDPAISSHFHLIQFWFEFAHLELRHWEWSSGEEGSSSGEELCRASREVYRSSVHTYSSETGTWSHIHGDWDEEEEQGLEVWRKQGLVKPYRGPRRAFSNGVLHFIVSDKDQIAAVDAQGVTQKLIPVPAMAEGERWPEPGYVAQSQGRLHYINQRSDAQLFIWVLEDYDTQEWVVKHSVSLLELLGKKRHTHRKKDFRVVTMHPDGNVVYIVQNWNRKLISYGMDHKLLSVIDTLKDVSWAEHFVPYVPYFSVISAHN